MKSLIFLLFSICTFSIAYSQNERYYYFFTDAQIKENIELDRLKSCQVLEIIKSDFFLCTVIAFGAIAPKSHDCISVGKVKLIDNVMYCYDRRLNRTYKFKQIDFYTLEAMNHTAVFVKGTKLYLHLGSASGKGFRAFFQNSDLIKSDYWKTGVKNGIHMYFDDNKSEQLIYYRNNIIIDSITFSYSDSTYIEKRIKFLKKCLGNEYNVSDYPYPIM
jgi:hypothetical protein